MSKKPLTSKKTFPSLPNIKASKLEAVDFIVWKSTKLNSNAYSIMNKFAKHCK